MPFFADFHIHSHYSRATARDLNLENLHYHAQLKGLTVVGTGDFTQPSWFAEIREKLVPAEDGLFALNPGLAGPINAQVPQSCRGEVRFVLSAEISNIYKKNGQTRKNHNVLLMPSLESVEKMNTRLDAIGNIVSDGRPILGLDARNLLEIMLEVNPEGLFIPAHIWTPWFSLLGSKSGFDSIGECFEDLSGHIHALETGLSSDPPMNWRVSSLDGRTLVSNSDAHSPGKLAREANIFGTELSFPAMRRALETGRDFLGTIEFYPEEGKYHLDGHRKCNVRLLPRQSLEGGCLCPVCGKPLTLGVLHRVEELSDREDGQLPESRHPFYSLVPLGDMLSQVLGVGPASKKVKAAHMEILAALGPELHILKDATDQELARSPVKLLDEAVRRMRSGDIVLEGGYDGEFGTVAVFAPGEREKLLGQQTLFAAPPPRPPAPQAPLFAMPQAQAKPVPPAMAPDPPDLALEQEAPPAPLQERPPQPPKAVLNDAQEQAVRHTGSPLLIKAGPGTGKTRTLAHRIARLVEQGCAAPESILAITFTNQAAREMARRLEELVGPDGAGITAATFHSFCLMLLRESAEREGRAVNVLSEKDRLHFLKEAIKAAAPRKFSPEAASAHISNVKQQLLTPKMAQFPDLGDKGPAMAAVYAAYQDLVRTWGLLDFDDLLFDAVRMMEADSMHREGLQQRFSHVCVDEYQDVNPVQYRLLRLLCPPGADLAVIGDPDQAIYGFRGSDAAYFNRFAQDYPGAAVVQLAQNYRSTETVLSAASQVLGGQRHHLRLFSGIQGAPRISVVQTPTSAAEAESVIQAIESIVGGISHFSLDSGRVDEEHPQGQWGFGDFAVLYRTRQQAAPLMEAFDRSGIPYQVVDKRRLMDHPGVEELVSYVRLAHGAGTDRDLLRVLNFPKRGISEKTIGILSTHAQKQGGTLIQALEAARRLPLPGLSHSQQLKVHAVWKAIRDARENTAGMPLDKKLEHIIYEIPLENLYARTGSGKTPAAVILDMAGEFRGSPAQFCDHLILAGDADTSQPVADRVSLMTMHASKGLEFQGVFVTGCEDGLIPFFREGMDSDPEEELRLFYVAVTRAKRRLWLSFAKRRRIYGKVLSQRPSPFLEKIEEALKDVKEPFKKTKKPEPVQIGLGF